MKVRSWKAWEYRVLEEGHDEEKTARILKRDVAEVRDKFSSYFDTTLCRWYERHRVPGTPDSACRMWLLAIKIWRSDFSKVVERGELEEVVYGVLKECFRHFKPTKVPSRLTVEEGFIRHFAYWLRRRLRDRAKSKSERRPVCFSQLPDGEPRLAENRHYDYGKRNELAIWSRHLFHLALPRLERRMRKVIELRYLQNMDSEQISEVLGIRPKTISNQYSFSKIVEAFKKEVHTMVMAIPAPNLERIIYYLHYDADFTEKDIAELLCIPREKVKTTLAGICHKVMSGMNRDRAMMLME